MGTCRMYFDRTELEKDQIIQLVREYVEVANCTCNPSQQLVCWKHLFGYNLNHLDAEIKNEEILH